MHRQHNDHIKKDRLSSNFSTTNAYFETEKVISLPQPILLESFQILGADVGEKIEELQYLIISFPIGVLHTNLKNLQ